jgi:adenylate cyclase class 2
MAKSNRENEIKLAFPSAETAVGRLLSAGASAIRERAFEDNVLFDLESRPLTTSGRLLRLRVVGNTSLLTFKGPVSGEHRHKLRIEHETTIADPEALRSILLGLGFEPIYRYQKFRATYALGNVEVAVDETPLGVFVELEGAPDDVDRAAAAIGAAPSEYIRSTYRELHEQDAAKRGIAVGDLLMPSPGRPSSTR